MAWLWYMFWAAPWVILVVGYPFYTLALETGNGRLRRTLVVLLAGVAPALFLAQLVSIFAVGNGE